MHKIQLFLESIPENSAKVKLLIGDNSRKMAIAEQWDYIPDDSTIEDATINAGYGTEFAYARLICVDDKGRQCLSRSLPIAELPSSASTIEHRLVSAVIESNESLRRFVDTVTSTLEKREDTLTSMIDQLILAKEETVSAQSTSLALDLALQNAEAENDVDIKERALASLQNIVELYMSKHNKDMLRPENLMAVIKANPQLIDKMMENQELVELIGDRIMSDSTSEN